MAPIAASRVSTDTPAPQKGVIRSRPPSHFPIKANPRATHESVQDTSSWHAYTRAISSNSPRAIQVPRIIHTPLFRPTLQTRQRRTNSLRRANTRAILCARTRTLGVVHARFPRQTRRQAPGVTKPLLRLLGLSDADAATICPGGGRVAGIAGVIDADLVGPCALDVGDATAGDGLGGHGVGTVTRLLDGEAGKGVACLALGAGWLVGGERAGSFTGAGAEVGVFRAAAQRGGGLDADFLLGALGELGEAAESRCLLLWVSRG
ncbi:MAG: hypothetical protein LQ343_007067 [Gyalolechia ehrenbergii]|nr:MAG: hypothetical protein LQ343_007067 [Gyalolechia ehrenbergii]